MRETENDYLDDLHENAKIKLSSDSLQNAEKGCDYELDGSALWLALRIKSDNRSNKRIIF